MPDSNAPIGNWTMVQIFYGAFLIKAQIALTLSQALFLFFSACQLTAYACLQKCNTHYSSSFIWHIWKLQQNLQFYRTSFMSAHTFFQAVCDLWLFTLSNKKSIKSFSLSVKNGMTLILSTMRFPMRMCVCVCVVRVVYIYSIFYHLMNWFVIEHQFLTAIPWTHTYWTHIINCVFTRIFKRSNHSYNNSISTTKKTIKIEGKFVFIRINMYFIFVLNVDIVAHVVYMILHFSYGSHTQA